MEKPMTLSRRNFVQAGAAASLAAATSPALAQSQQEHMGHPGTKAPIVT